MIHFLSAASIAPTASERDIIQKFLAALAERPDLLRLRLDAVERVDDAASTLLVRLSSDENDPSFGQFYRSETPTVDAVRQMARELSIQHQCNIIAILDQPQSAALGRTLTLDARAGEKTAQSLLDHARLDSTGNIALAEQQLKAALLLAKQSPQIERPRQILSVLVLLAKLYVDTGNGALARACIEESLRWLSAMNEWLQIKWAPTQYIDLAMLEAQLGNYDQALALIEIDQRIVTDSDQRMIAVIPDNAADFDDLPDTTGLDQDEAAEIIADFLDQSVGTERGKRMIPVVPNNPADLDEPPDTTGLDDDDAADALDDYLEAKSIRLGPAANVARFTAEVEQIRSSHQQIQTELHDLLAGLGSIREKVIDNAQLKFPGDPPSIP